MSASHRWSSIAALVGLLALTTAGPASAQAPEVGELYPPQPDTEVLGEVLERDPDDPVVRGDVVDPAEVREIVLESRGLPITGREVLPLTAGGALLLAVGALALRSRRRSRPRSV